MRAEGHGFANETTLRATGTLTFQGNPHSFPVSAGVHPHHCRHTRLIVQHILIHTSPIRSVSSPSGVHSALRGLRETLQAVLSRRGSAAQVNAVVAMCHAMAEGAILRKGHLMQLIRAHGLNLRDLAFDTISDLFARDAEGRFPMLNAYFVAHDLTAATDKEAYFLLQRLVLGRVRNGLFRLYGEMDPQLARILRNIKIAAHALETFTEVDRPGESCLAPTLCDTLQHLPSVDAGQLTLWLSEVTSGNEFIPELLGRLAKVLREQSSHSRIVPLVTIALAFRSLYEQKHTTQIAEHTTWINDAAIDAEHAIRQCCEALKIAMYPKYVDRGKVGAEIFDAYFRVIEEMLEMRFIENDGADFPLSECFQRHMPGIPLQEYRRSHRSRLEYLARLAQDKVTDFLLN
jgi:hypothetical protein